MTIHQSSTLALKQILQHVKRTAMLGLGMSRHLIKMKVHSFSMNLQVAYANIIHIVNIVARFVRQLS